MVSDPESFLTGIGKVERTERIEQDSETYLAPRQREMAIMLSLNSDANRKLF